MAAVDFVISQGNTIPSVTATITDPTGNPVNLTSATVTFVMRSEQQASATVNAAATIVSAPAGTVSYTFTTAQTGTPGLYNAQFNVTESGGGTYTYPNVGFMSIEVQPSLASMPQTLVSIADAKDVLNFLADDDVHDTKIQRWINACQPVIERITGPIVQQTIEEWHDGGVYQVVLRRRPSTALGTSPVLIINDCTEYIGPVPFPLAIVGSPDEAVLYSTMLDGNLGRLVRRTSGGGIMAFPNMPMQVHVWYTAGQATVPANVYEATLELLRINYQQTAQSTNKGLGSSLSTTYDEAPQGPPSSFFLPNRVREMLAPNRRAPSVA